MKSTHTLILYLDEFHLLKCNRTKYFYFWFPIYEWNMYIILPYCVFVFWSTVLILLFSQELYDNLYS
jgi:hypothetical protein